MGRDKFDDNFINIMIVSILAIFILVFFVLEIRNCYADTSREINNKYRKGQWICWFTSVKDVSCGTYGWSKDKKLALKAAKELCQSHCDAKCKMDYCEK